MGLWISCISMSHRPVLSYVTVATQEDAARRCTARTFVASYRKGRYATTQRLLLTGRFQHCVCVARDFWCLKREGGCRVNNWPVLTGLIVVCLFRLCRCGPAQTRSDTSNISASWSAMSLVWVGPRSCSQPAGLGLRTSLNFFFF